MKRWDKIDSAVENLIRTNCVINEFKAKVLSGAILDLLVQEGLVIREEPVKVIMQGKEGKDQK